MPALHSATVLSLRPCVSAEAALSLVRCAPVSLYEAIQKEYGGKLNFSWSASVMTVELSLAGNLSVKERNTQMYLLAEGLEEYFQVPFIVTIH